MKKILYVEPAEYFPKNIRKKYKLGEYNDDIKTRRGNEKKSTTKKK